jgi:WD40 repeat protein
MLMTNEHALIGYENGQLHMVEQDTAHSMRLMDGHTENITCIVYCPELSKVITCSDDKTARVWNVATGECVHVLSDHTYPVFCAAVHGTTYVICTSSIVD